MFGIEYNVKDIVKQRICAILDVLFWVVLLCVVVWVFLMQQENRKYTDYKNVSAYISDIKVIENETDTNKTLKYELKVADNTYEYETRADIGSVGESVSMIMTPVDESSDEYKIETSLNEFLAAELRRNKSSAAIISDCIYVVILSLICNMSFMNIRKSVKRQVLLSDKQGRLNKDAATVK